MPHRIPFLLWSADAIGLAGVAAVTAYGFSNQSNHTGWEPFTSLAFFAPLALSGAAAVLTRRLRSRLFVPGTVAIAVGILGIAAVIHLDQTNRLVQYERWIWRGMP
jgi:hypothetical protein